MILHPGIRFLLKRYDPKTPSPVFKLQLNLSISEMY